MSGAQDAGEIVLEEGVGPVPVMVERNGGSISARFRLDEAPEMPETVPSHEEMAAVVSLERKDVVDVFAAGVGVDRL